MGSVDPMYMDMDCVLQDRVCECSKAKYATCFLTITIRSDAGTTPTNVSTAQSAMHQRFVPAAAAAIEVRHRAANLTKLKQAPQIRAFKEKHIKTGEVAIKSAQTVPRAMQPESKCDVRASHGNPIERRNNSKKRSSEARM